jgi:hypothetical protein
MSAVLDYFTPKMVDLMDVVGQAIQSFCCVHGSLSMAACPFVSIVHLSIKPNFLTTFTVNSYSLLFELVYPDYKNYRLQ